MPLQLERIREYLFTKSDGFMIVLSATLLAKVSPASSLSGVRRNYRCSGNKIKHLIGTIGRRAAPLTSASMSTIPAARPKVSKKLEDEFE